MVYKWIEFARRAILPPVCSVCGADGHGSRDLCPACYRDLPFNHCACERCAAPLPDGEVALCGRCLEHHWYFDSSCAPLLYRPPVSGLVTALKFNRRLSAARLLGELMSEHVLERAGILPQALIPVPLHSARLRRRGYNQALELSRILSRRLGIPVQAHACRRRRATIAQSGMAARERRRNVRNAFEYRGGPCPEHVALVDDVVTTGHTVNEIARVLRGAGAQRIEVWCAARTPPHE